MITATKATTAMTAAITAIDPALLSSEVTLRRG
jgi:hypothetical protein